MGKPQIYHEFYTLLPTQFVHLYWRTPAEVSSMIGDALEIAIIASMMVLVVYPSSLSILDAWQEWRRRRVRINRPERRR